MGCCGESGINPRGLLTSNHAALVNKCYPTDPGETGPRSAHLSTLLFYANSKPIKLVKVGEYLVKKVDADMGKSRGGFVAVSLMILNALMKECPPAHVNLMAVNVLRIIDLVLASPDPDLVLEAASTFVVFNNLYRHDTIIDMELTTRYSALVYKFCNHAVYTTKNSLTEQKYHLAGLRAIYSIASSDTFLLNPKAPEYVTRMIPAILSNLEHEYALKTSSSNNNNSRNHSASKPEGMIATPPMTTISSIKDTLFAHPLLQQSAESSLAALYKTSSSQSAKFLLTPTWAFLDAHKLWDDRHAVVRIVAVVCGSVPPQSQYVVMSSLLDLAKTDKKGKTAVDDAGRKAGVILGVTAVVASGVASGISVMELIQTLVGLAGETCGPAEVDRADGDVRKFHVGIIECVGSLAIHVAYPTQLNDMVGYIVNRIAKESQNTVAKKSLLRCLLRIVAVRRASLSPLESMVNLANGVGLDALTATPLIDDNDNNMDSEHFELDKFSTLTRSGMRSYSYSVKNKRSSLAFPAKISTLLVTPIVSLLADSNQDVRLLAALFLDGCFALDISDKDKTNSQADAEFLHTLCQKLYAYALAESSGPADYVAIGTLLALLVKRFGVTADGVGRSVPLLVTLLQDAEKHANMKKLAVRALLVDHLAELARLFGFNELKSFVSEKLDAGALRAVLPVTTSMETLSLSIQYWIIRNGSGDNTGIAARTFSGVSEIQDATGVSVGDILAFVKNLSALSPVHDKIGQLFVVDSAPGSDAETGAPPAMKKRLSIVVTGTNGLVAATTTGTSLTHSSSKHNVVRSFEKRADGESLRSGASSRLENPIKFEDLKDAISIHSTTAATESLRTITPVPSSGGKKKIDVKNLLNNISASISAKNIGQNAKLLEPSMLGKHSIRFSIAEKSREDVIFAEQPAQSPQMTLAVEGQE